MLGKRRSRRGSWRSAASCAAPWFGGSKALAALPVAAQVLQSLDDEAGRIRLHVHLMAVHSMKLSKGTDQPACTKTLALAARFWIVSFTVTRIPFHWLVPFTMSSPTWPVAARRTAQESPWSLFPAGHLLGRHSQRANLWSQNGTRGLLTAIPQVLRRH